MIIGNTHIGMVRKTNQDRFMGKVVSARMEYVVLCDGMGGENGGSIASEKAVEIIRAILDRELCDDIKEKDIKSVMDCAVAGANAYVYDLAQQDSALAGMGTTVIIAVIFDDMLYLVCAGDSRVYLLEHHNGQITQLTKDHTFVQMLIDNGEITKEEAANHPKRHYITKALGIEKNLRTDYYEYQLDEHSTILLCSDGLYNYISLDEAIPLAEKSLRDESVKPLIDAANSNGGGDNITVVLVSHGRSGGSC